MKTLCHPATASVLALLAMPAGLSAQDRVSQVDLVQVQLNLPGKITAGKSFIVLDEVENAGDQSAPRSVTGFCLSQDDVCDEKDLRLGARRVPPLQPRQTHFFQTAVKLPAEVPAGEYDLIAVADSTNAVVERYKSNNSRATKTLVLPAKR
jgi:hypothetical protein